ncbi:nickel-dependent hydrogenase large subunit [Aestuariirhabdus sp. Z084]|uniref:nickel-dependent hydrogenase large subunit n=1 Tax=Aestuariirhabdus haliotis TaxID=2918751 RepID=UPI00201B4562|nr:nickel-dependent hydrogenase large subunit [Aestuariirhabdus haliotis]MCL6415143.1 nickel-dependent hydrogenase large subunit [Aestuariirhabdus haliotis]MCL6420018.1 nickel-dependent hydrogenase large subunit [Aestuariirhabdus haliotis]
MTQRIIGPFSRVEGNLELRLQIKEDRVAEARVSSQMYRGFEQMLEGKKPIDALVITPRICGICSVSQSVAAARALADLTGAKPPPNGVLAANLVHACENLADLFTHFYLFFMPDFANPAYRNEAWYGRVAERFRAVSGSAAGDALSARAELLHLMGLLAGKWPHTLAIQPGGSTRSIDASERLRLLTVLRRFRAFLEKTTFGTSLESIVELSQQDQWHQLSEPETSDCGRFFALSRNLKLDQLGRGGNAFMSFGGHAFEGESLFAAGLYTDRWQPLEADAIAEDVSHSWMQASPPRHPREGATKPTGMDDNGYSWCKAPRLNGRVIEVGALARQSVNGNPLALDLLRSGGANVQSRILMRLWEMARLLLAMENWAELLVPGEPFFEAGLASPQDGEGVGMVEAARGSLGHWMRVRNGLIDRYQIIAPTTWNFSPRDADGQPGALEQALSNAPVRKQDDENPVAVQHIVRSFDPCMACTVH